MITAHADVVGSLLRPQELSEARSRFAAGEVEASRLRELEDRAVCDAIAMQEAAGLEIVTDGEMRRQSFQSQMTAAVEGFGDFTMDAFLWGEWHNAQGTVRTARPQNLGATGKLVRKRWLSADEFAFLKNKTSRVAKITLPSPGLWANFWSREHSRAAYPTLDSFLADIVQLLREEVQELVRLGARLHPNRCAALRADARRQDTAFLRSARVESGPMVDAWHRARQCASSRDFQVSLLRSISDAAIRAAGGSPRAVTNRSVVGSSGGSRHSGSCSSTTTSAPARSRRSRTSPKTNSSCSA